MIVPSESYSFVLVPEEIYSQLQSSTVEPVETPATIKTQAPVAEPKKAKKAEKAEQPASSTQSPNPAKKAILKKKQS